jgi:polyhydroxyalkanoate synthesis regulator phasin
MLDTVKNSFLATLGVLSLTQEKLQQVIEDLIRRGQITSEQGKVLLEEILTRGQNEGQAISQRLGEELSRLAERTPFATWKELRRLEDRVRSLEIRLGELQPPTPREDGAGQGV